MMLTIFILLLVYQLKHFLADYPLQTSYMLGKFKSINWQWPLMAHAGLHGAFTFGIALAYLHLNHQDWPPVMRLQATMLCAGFDFWVHFAMDRVKASPAMMGRWKALSADEYQRAKEAINLDLRWRRMEDGGHTNDAREYYPRQLRGNTYFWWALGFDQMVHHLTHYAVIAFLVTR